MKNERVALINGHCFLKDAAKMRGDLYFLLYCSVFLLWFAASRGPYSQPVAITSWLFFFPLTGLWYFRSPGLLPQNTFVLVFHLNNNNVMPLLAVVTLLAF